jgi:plasmid stability protein
MSYLVVRSISGVEKRVLEARAKSNGNSLEKEVRQILVQPVEPQVRLGTLFARRFAGIGLDEPVEELRGFGI